MLLIFLLTNTITSLSLANAQTGLLILPNTPNPIAPFTLNPETESEKSISYHLEIKCSDNVAKNILFSGPYADLCTDSSKIDTLENFNSNFKETFASLMDRDNKIKDLKISYTIHYTEDNKSPIVFEQELSIATEIPIHRVNKVIYYQPNSSTAFDLKILEIQDIYFNNAKHNEYTIVLNNNKFPDWLHYDFESNELYFAGKTPYDLEDSLSFSFSIMDRQTGLTSENIVIETKSSIEGESTGGKTLVIVLFLIFTGVIASILIIIFISSKKKRKDASNLKNSVNAHNKHFQDNTTNVLSDSILQWNKKLVERHRTKTFNLADYDTGIDKPGRSPGFAYEKFDDSFEMTENDKSGDIRISDKISEIRIDEESKQMDEGNKSSFFDDIRF